MKCFYHMDADGKCAAHLVATFAKRTPDHKGIECIPINYGMKFPLETTESNERIYIVDYSIEPQEMRELLKITKDVTWIDHHITAIEKYKDFEYDIRGVRYDGIAGCMLTYLYLMDMTDRGQGRIGVLDKKEVKFAPDYIKYIADRDVWDWKYGKDTAHFNLGLDLYANEPLDMVWGELATDKYKVKEVQEKGKVVEQYRDKLGKSACASRGFVTEFHGYKAYALNIPFHGSEWLKSIDDGSYDLLIVFSYNGIDYSVSLYSTSIDTTTISKLYGGGGHKGASGFRIDGSELFSLFE